MKNPIIYTLNVPLARCLVWLKRIALALERMAPPPPRRPRRPRQKADFSVATPADFDAGYDSRNTDADAEWSPR